MKKSDLQKIIHEAILEVLDEAIQKTTIDYKNPSQPDKVLDIDSSDVNTINKLKSDPNVASATIGNKKLKEMARKAIKYALTDDYESKLAELPYASSEKRMRWVNGIIDHINQEGPSEPTVIAQEKFNVPQPRIADYVRDMVRLGILKPEQEGIVPQFLQPDEEREEPIRGGEEFLIGPYLDLGTDASADNEEDEIEAEPSPEELEPAEPVAKLGGLSDEDYQSFLKYTDYKERLNKVKSNLAKSKRFKGVADIGPDTKDADILRLRNLKKSLEDRLSALVAGSKYLQDREARLTKKVVPPVEPTEPEEEEIEDTVAETFEYEKRILQHRAGIIK